jgi:hypothetical protein
MCVWHLQTLKAFASCCLSLQYLLQSCSRGERGIVEDMCYEIRRAEACVDYVVCPSRTTERELCSWRVGHEEVDNHDGWYKDHKLGTGDGRELVVGIHQGGQIIKIRRRSRVMCVRRTHHQCKGGRETSQD